jgi:hypothetical protein
MRRVYALPLCSTLLAALPLLPQAVGAQDNPWPLDIPTQSGHVITIYQPQPEALKDNLLTGRAAMSITPPNREPIFGALWFSARISADADTREATLGEIRVTRVRWPESTAQQQGQFTVIVEAAFPEEVSIDMDRLSASLATAEREQRSLEGLKNEAPKIVFTDELAILLLYDGAPQSRAIPDTDLEQVLNTSLAVVKDTRSGTYWLSGGKVWYSAKDPLGPWTPNARPPEEITRIVPPDTSSDSAPDPPLAIVTATEPTELIVTDGPPKWQSLGGGELLYVENTENPILRAVDPAYIYILLSGRWFRAASFDGPWTFVHPDSLPASFEEIPPESPVAGVRVSVAGTQEAEDAMLDAQIPQTAAIERSKAKLEVNYDGEPQFTDIAGTKIAYATNTPAQVLRIDGRYYAVDEGVWFTAGSAKGPWAVADSVPEDEIQQIPPSAPVYNTTYVHVYQSTPQVVYVGYYPGYLWSFPYYGVPVYGTGWYYPPYWGPGGYYPRYPTWGFHVHYNPWYGWSFGWSWGVGFMRVGVSFGGGWGYRGGWYGGGYRRPVYINARDVNINRGNVNIGNSIGGNRPAGGNIDRGNVANNIYNRPASRDRVADRPAAARPGAGARPAQQPAAGARPAQQPASGARPSTRDNNVFADRDGNVHRRTDNGWENRQGGSWQPQRTPTPQPAQPSARPGARPSTGATAPSNLNRDFQARQNGAARAAQSPSRAPARTGGVRRR